MINLFHTAKKELQLQCNPSYINYSMSLPLSNKVFKYRMCSLKTCHTFHTSLMHLACRVFSLIQRKPQKAYWQRTLFHTVKLFWPSYCCVKEKKKICEDLYIGVTIYWNDKFYMFPKTYNTAEILPGLIGATKSHTFQLKSGLVLLPFGCDEGC